MSNRPVIGLTMDTAQRSGRLHIGEDYIKSIEMAGGLPLAIPFNVDHALIPSILDTLDGILFIGGDDLDPSLYGELWHPNAIRIDPRRQEFELAMLAEVERRRMPAMGICLGSQLINVFRGGTLHQFLPDVPRQNPIEHRKDGRDRPEHPVRVDTETKIGRVIGQREIIANTFHKQAAKELGRGLKLVATAPDGIIEAFEDPNMPLFAAIQWHPERLHDRPEHLALFRMLVEEAGAQRVTTRRA